MPRDLPVGNGSLLVNFDHTGQIRDIYWPHVGQENHTSGRVGRMGVWVDNRLQLAGQRGLAASSLPIVVDSLDHRFYRWTNSALGSQPSACSDGVDFHEEPVPAPVHGGKPCSRFPTCRVRLFFCLDLNISGTTVGDSAYYEPERRGPVSLQGQTLVYDPVAPGSAGSSGKMAWINGPSAARMYAIWKVPGRTRKTVYCPAIPVAQGSIDSVCALHFVLEPHGRATGWYSLAVGVDHAAVSRISESSWTPQGTAGFFWNAQPPTGNYGSPRAGILFHQISAGSESASIDAACSSCAPRSTTRARLLPPMITILPSSTETPTHICGPGTVPWSRLRSDPCRLFRDLSPFF